jgi:hypothetical protein
MDAKSFPAAIVTGIVAKFHAERNTAEEKKKRKQLIHYAVRNGIASA